MKRKILLLIFIGFFHVAASSQCAMCRAVLESEQGQSTAEGINDGIVYLMAVPYILIAGLGIFIYRKYRTR
ncbi:hypothetical protein V8G61_10085 [Gaetbulibacter sp. M240]|uniref:hypothetical protein n=1 Tax=Gaetbulibacter sp. M240 TaxID=3126511 RepID=UPI00374FBB5B